MIDDYQMPEKHQAKIRQAAADQMRAAYDELEEVALAAAAAGVPLSRMVIRLPTVKPSQSLDEPIQIESAIGFIPEGAER